MSFADIESGGGRGDRGGYQGGVPPSVGDYNRETQRIAQNISQISSNVNAINKLVNQLGTRNDTQDLRDRMHALIDACRSYSREANLKLKQLATSSKGQDRESQQRRITQAKLQKDFQAVLKRFQEIAKLSAQKERSTLAVAKQKAAASSPPGGSGGSSASNPFSDPGAEERMSLLNDQKKQQLLHQENDIQFNQALILEREEGIKEVEATMNEVAEIFNELGVLVNEQGQMIDNIEGNVEAVANRTDKAVKELSSASKYQKRARNKMCCIAIILLVIGFALVLVFTDFFRK